MIDETAVDWVIRQRDPGFADWEAFADWLAASPAHAEAYHAAQALDSDMAALAPAGDGAAPEAKPGFSRRGLWMSGLVAASLAGLVGVSQLLPATSRYETGMGERRELQLSDGSRILLNGGTVLRVWRRDERRVELERGQANFRVVHRAGAPFRVAVGEARLVNIGTTFDVTRSGATTILAVSEGAVAFNPDGENIRVDAGRRLAVRDGSARALLTAVDPASVGGWQEGQLVYDGVPLSLVAAEIERTTGAPIRVAADAADIPFRGAIHAGPDGERLAADLAALSGTRAVAQEKGWVLQR